MNRSFKINMYLALLWVVMLVPTIIWFKDSVLWVAGISIYALVIGHVSTAEAARAGVSGATLRQIRALANALAALMEAYDRDNPDEDLHHEIDELRASLDEE